MQSNDRRGFSSSDSTRLEGDYASELAVLAATSQLLARLGHMQCSREHEIQAMCNSVWTVVQQQYSVSDKCGDRQQFTVTHQYSQQVAVVDADKFDALQAEMRSHLTFATSDLASAIFEHALAEERLDRLELRLA